MKILNMALAAFICLSILASAVPDSVVTGPYNVTFDLGIPKEAYRVEIAEPNTNESSDGISTEYQIDLVNKTGLFNRASINITSYETEQVISTQDDFVKIAGAALALVSEMISYIEINDIEVSRQEIDGYDGAVAFGDFNVSGTNIGVFYLGMYQPSSTTLVILYSMYPWDEGTRSLLETIHVEENNSTSLVGSI
jgi:hypothetical protein